MQRNCESLETVAGDDVAQESGRSSPCLNGSGQDGSNSRVNESVTEQNDRDEVAQPRRKGCVSFNHEAAPAAWARRSASAFTGLSIAQRIMTMPGDTKDQ
jgi:hypothetical protein